MASRIIIFTSPSTAAPAPAPTPQLYAYTTTVTYIETLYWQPQLHTIQLATPWGLPDTGQGNQDYSTVTIAGSLTLLPVLTLTLAVLILEDTNGNDYFTTTLTQPPPPTAGTATGSAIGSATVTGMPQGNWAGWNPIQRAMVVFLSVVIILVALGMIYIVVHYQRKYREAEVWWNSRRREAKRTKEEIRESEKQGERFRREADLLSAEEIGERAREAAENVKIG